MKKKLLLLLFGLIGFTLISGVHAYAQTNSSILVLNTSSHADLHVYDSEGRHVGYNPVTNVLENEIPGASYQLRIIETGELIPYDPVIFDPVLHEQIITIANPTPGTLRIVINESGGGEYHLTVEESKGSELISSKIYSGTVEEEEEVSVNVTIAKIVEPTISIDPEPPETTSPSSIPLLSDIHAMIAVGLIIGTLVTLRRQKT